MNEEIKKKLKENFKVVFSWVGLLLVIFGITLFFGFGFKACSDIKVTTYKEDPITIETIDKRVSKIEKEILQLQEDNRLCNIIGAYTIINTELVDPTPENVQDLVLICKCWYPDIIMAQYKLESAKGTSYVAKNNNNLFGMRKAQVRKSVRCKAFDKKGYAVYNNWQLSVIDRILWEEFEFHNRKPSRSAYLSKIKKIYAEDESYMSKINNLAKEYKYLVN